MKVMLVDDSAFMRKVVKEMITSDAYEVVGECSSGLDALEKFRSLAPDLILMDYNMPGMNGVETARSIIDYEPSATIIMITSIDSTEKVIEALQNGVKDYLTKPFTKEDLLNKITDVTSE